MRRFVWVWCSRTDRRCRAGASLSLARCTEQNSEHWPRRLHPRPAKHRNPHRLHLSSRTRTETDSRSSSSSSSHPRQTLIVPVCIAYTLERRPKFGTAGLLRRQHLVRTLNIQIHLRPTRLPQYGLGPRWRRESGRQAWIGGRQGIQVANPRVAVQQRRPAVATARQPTEHVRPRTGHPAETPSSTVDRAAGSHVHLHARAHALYCVDSIITTQIHHHAHPSSAVIY
jgi:hypothetical protein